MIYCVQPFLGVKRYAVPDRISRTEEHKWTHLRSTTLERIKGGITQPERWFSGRTISIKVRLLCLSCCMPSARLSPISLLKPPFPPERVLVFSQHRSPSVSPSLALHSFVSGCLWSWANLLEAKCLYLGQLRIRSHVVSATPKPARLPPRNCHSLSLSFSLSRYCIQVCQQWLGRTDINGATRCQGDAAIRGRRPRITLGAFTLFK